MAFYDEVFEGLKEAVSYEEGKLPGVRTRRLTKPVDETRAFTPSENASAAQDLSAECMVPEKRV